ncbi:iron-containing alcohol dehydrogenase [Deferribacter autotrophicus]|uniref:Iron-containing alcohol dehydrogenase n=1 Tax=Deferribacter autotrophicus TaxID=500465 RepID=A0A5A8F0Z7_9BACT|nr:iron-containing alcohol dehydrogenase family protein [Deferribacter autotrophicus]KAA0257329.1 iron-containing alcohol dehydrogenase [Deferribacter autotrophicus]
MKNFSFYSPVKVILSDNFKDELEKILNKYKNIALICGKNAAYKTGFVDLLKDTVKESLFIFDEVEENPSINTVIKGGKFVRQNKCDLIVAFGGGSSLDAAKAISAFATNNKGFYELLSVNGLPNPTIPIVAIPTTCGTGSEVNHYAIITDYEKKDKINFAKEECFPKFAILNHEYLNFLNENTLYATIFDAFTHAFEGYLSKRANPFSDMVATQSIKIILENLEKEKLDDSSLKNFLYASTLAGIVILHTGTTLLHALGYYLTNHKSIHHGMANFILLPNYIEMLEHKNVDKYYALKKIFPNMVDILNKYRGMFKEKVDSILNEKELSEMCEYALNKKNAENTLFSMDKKELMSFFGF